MPGVTDDGFEPIRHISTAKVVAVRGDSLEYRDDRVVGEAPLEIRAAGPGQDPVAVAVTMRTPGHEAELAADIETEAPAYLAAFKAGDPENAGVFFGEAAGLISDAPPAGEIINRMVHEACNLIDGARNFRA